MALTQSLIKPHDNIIGVSRIDYFDDRYYNVCYKEQFKLKKQKRYRTLEAHFPSVTSVLGVYPKDFLPQWRGDVGNARADQILAEANKMGSFIHFAAEVLCRKGVVVYNPLYNEQYTKKQLDALERKHKEIVVVRFQKEWIQIRRVYMLLQELKFEITGHHTETEQTVFSVKHKYAGTLDLLCEIGEGTYNINGAKPLHLDYGLYLGDWKSGKAISETYFMQQAAYLEAVIEMTPELDKYIKGCLIFHTNAKTKAGIEGLATRFIDRKQCKEYFRQFLAVYEVYKISNPIPDPKEFDMSTMFYLNSPAITRAKKRSRGKK